MRNRDKKYYPFNYPSLDDITTTGKNNFIDGKPAGLWDEGDIIHTRNYGACRSALWEDLIASGGADEHVDYLGYICAPYEMTWRLVNAGKKEIWHESEWTTTCGTRANSGTETILVPTMDPICRRLHWQRVNRPLLENPALKELRLGRTDRVLDKELLQLAFSDRDFAEWTVSKMRLDMIKLGKVLSRKFLPRAMKTYVRSRFEALGKIRSRQ